MMLSEFEKLTGLEVTTAEYEIFLTTSVAEQTMHVSMCAAAAEVCNGNLWTELLKTIPHRHFYPMGSNSSSRIITPHRPQ